MRRFKIYWTYNAFKSINSALMDGRTLLDLSDEDQSTFQINKEYADKYDSWRNKEELQKLEGRLKNGQLGESGDEDSSEETEDEFAELDSTQMEKNFYRTLSALKAKDGRLYDPKFTFFNCNNGDEQQPIVKKKKKRNATLPVMRLRDFERERLLNQRHSESDEEEKEKCKTYVAEQSEIIKSFHDIPLDDDENLFQRKERTIEQEHKEEAEYVEWLKGERDTCNDTEMEDMKHLREFWNNNTNEADTYLRDYLLNKRYKEEGDEDDDDAGGEESGELKSGQNFIDYDCDEEHLDAQEAFENKFNFRFEEPMSNTILTYPRKIETSVRKKDNKRQRVREAHKERLNKEKLRRQEELKLLKSMKRREFEDKMTKLKESANLSIVNLNEADLEADFDPKEHDKTMQAMFGDEYYDDDVVEKKPVFSDSASEDEGEPCTSTATTFKQLRRKYEQEKNSLGAEGSKLMEKCLDEYYKLDYEDVIADGIACRFKYRNVIPNDFGLSTKEVLKASDKELNAWVSVKKMSQYLPDNYEQKLCKAYEKKGHNAHLKQKVLSSLYGKVEPRKKKTGVKNVPSQQRPARLQLANKTPDELKRTINLVDNLSDSRMLAYGMNPKKTRHSVKYGKSAGGQKL